MKKNNGSAAMRLHILIVDDEPDMITTLTTLLETENHHVDSAENGSSALHLIKDNTYDLILSDLSMPDFDGLYLLEQAKQEQPQVEIMIITAYGTVETAVNAMKKGALNYFIKPIEPEDLLLHIRQLCQRLKHTIQKKQQTHFHNLVGKSPAMKRLFYLIPRVARMHCSVLIQGESGVGKELVAHAIHACSKYKDNRFVPVDCGSISDSLLESELFGHKQGSFTGSTADRVGLIESANGGTLFFDEVGNASAFLQSRLLRVIEDKKVRRVGENSMIPLQVRILGASNANLADMVKQGTFREDLYYRLCGFIIDIPPLRDRREDIPLLANHFLQQNSVFYDDIPNGFTPEAMETLQKYSWPGNVRELRTVVDRATGLVEGSMIDKNDLNFDHTPTAFLQSGQEHRASTNLLDTPFYTAVESFEQKYLSELLKASGGNLSQASQLSGASRKTIREKGKKYGLLE